MCKGTSTIDESSGNKQESRRCQHRNTLSNNEQCPNPARRISVHGTLLCDKHSEILDGLYKRSNTRCAPLDKSYVAECSTPGSRKEDYDSPEAYRKAVKDAYDSPQTYLHAVNEALDSSGA